MDMQTSFLDRLFEEGLLIETGVDGLYGRSGQFEDVIAAFERLIDRTGGPDSAEAIRFPPGINRAYFEKSGYMKASRSLRARCIPSAVANLTMSAFSNPWMRAATGQRTRKQPISC